MNATTKRLGQLGVSGIAQARDLGVRGAAYLRGLGVSSGVLAYRPEAWSDERWSHAYSSGQLDFFADLRELARYSVLVGLIRRLTERSAVLDIGCGPGLLVLQLAPVDLASYYGIDISPDAIGKAAHLVDERTVFVVGDVMTAELPKVDVVVCNEVLYYVPSPAAFLDRMATVLRPDGLLLTSLWRHPGDRSLWRMLDARFERVDVVYVRDSDSPFNQRGWRVSCHRVRKS